MGEGWSRPNVSGLSLCATLPLGGGACMSKGGGTVGGAWDDMDVGGACVSSGGMIVVLLVVTSEVEMVQ